MNRYFDDFDFTDFWDNSGYYSEDYISEPPTQELIESVEKELGFKLPESYIELMRKQNGGLLKRWAFPSDDPLTNWDDYIGRIEGILGIGREKRYSLCGERGNKYMIEQGGYPNIGIYFGDCPSAGHEMICLDYRKNGKNGEPEVIFIDQEADYRITFLAENFENFIKSLDYYENLKEVEE